MYILDNNDCISLYESENLHWNPTNQKHGIWGDKSGYHKGDIGSFKADILGNGTLSFSTKEWCIGCDDFKKKNIEKKVLIICEDIKNEPSKVDKISSTILSCGIIQKMKF